MAKRKALTGWGVKELRPVHTQHDVVRRRPMSCSGSIYRPLIIVYALFVLYVDNLQDEPSSAATVDGVVNFLQLRYGQLPSSSFAFYGVLFSLSTQSCFRCAFS